MAKRRRPGGFGGDGGFGGSGGTSSAPPATTPRNTPATNQTRGLNMRQRSQKRRRQSDKRAGKGNAFDSLGTGGSGTTTIDQQGDALAFENQDPAQMRLGALGVLGNMGINTAPGGFGANQVPFIEDTISGWVDENLGGDLVNANDLSWADTIAGHAGRAVAPGAAPGTTPENWAGLTEGMWQQNKGKGKGKNKGKGKGLGGGQSATPPAAVPSQGPVLTPQEQEHLRAALTASWAAATPMTRGYDSSRWVGPKRTIQF